MIFSLNNSSAMEKVYAVIDIKSFYASCECADRGLDLFTAPLVVADPERSESTIVMSVTPFLKEKYGCSNVCRVRDLPEIPGLIKAKPRMRYYLEMSAKVVSIFLDFIDEEDLHVYSVDESFLHLTPYLSMYHCTAEELVRRIQKRIKDELGLLATAGLGPNMFMAKVCLDTDGKKRVPYLSRWTMQDVPTKLWKITPLTKIWGIGRGISSHLARLGIYNLESLAKADTQMLQKEFGIIGLQLQNLANGKDEADVREKYVPKTRNLSVGQTLMKDYSIKGAKLLLREMNDDLCFRLRYAHYKAGCVSVYVGYAAGEGGGFSRQMSLSISTDDNDALFEAEMEIFQEFIENKPIRNLGICFSSLTPYNGQQYSLFESPEENAEKRRLYQALDEIQTTYGRNAVLRATSLTEDSTARMRHEQIGGHHA